MNRIKSILSVIFLLTVFSSCIEYFHPDLGSNVKAKYVVDGQVTNEEGFQSVFVSMTSSLEKPNYSPLSFCDVKITDNLGNIFNLEELVNERGHYRVWMGKEYLKPGKSYQVTVKTASGVEIVSDFDQMPECPDIDSIYYSRKDMLSSDPDKTTQGIQFYVDFDRKNTNSHFYKWEIVETWEHHATYPITWYLDPETGGWVLNTIPDFSRLKCWTTKKMTEFFTLSTENITQSKFIMNALHYVDNQTQRLTYCYSALVNQYAISEPAFSYWDELRKNNLEQGGLYGSQPLNIKGNLKSTTNPELEVLGFFSAYSVKSKRIIVQKLEHFDVLEPSCAPPHLPPTGGTESHNYEIEISGVRYILLDGCVECDYMSGSTTKPSYWPY